MSIVTLTTDFGLQDHYVAAMKGVILKTSPKVTLVDVTHEIAPHNVLQGALVLDQVWDYYPPKTIHVAVVDPGVGTSRRILAGQYNGQIVLVPDNGLISLVHRRARLEEMRVVENARLVGNQPSMTFHGRDVFAPIAGYLAKGGRLSDVGPTTDHVQVLQLPQPKFNPDHSLTGQVIYVDRFGTLVTNITSQDVGLAYNRRPYAEIHVADTSVGPLRATYSDVELGAPLALLGSGKLLEVAVNQGSAADHFKAGPGTAIHIR